MARLPEIDTIGVQDSSGTYAQVDEARRKAVDTVRGGLTELGGELVKTQIGKAKAAYDEGASKVAELIDSNSVVSTEFLRQHLGKDFDSMDPAVKAQVTQEGIDLATGETKQFDREDIPMWTVAGTLYDSKMRGVVSEASKHITTGGWRTEFQDNVQGETLARKIKMNEAQTKALDAYLTQTQTETALTRASAAAAMPDPAARAAKFSEVRADVRSSKTMDPLYKEKLISQVDKLEETAPLYEALRRNDYGQMAELLGQLNDPAKFTKLTPEERAAHSTRFRAEIKGFQTAVENENKRVLKEAGERGWNYLFAKKRSGAPLTFRDIPPPGTIAAQDQKEMLAYVENEQKGVEPKTDLALYDQLTRAWRDQPDRFAELQLTRFVNRLSPADFKHFVDLQVKPGGADQYDNVVTTDEAIDSKLFEKFKINAKKPANDQETLDVSRVKSIIQTSLARLGKKPTLAERDDVIERVLNAEMQIEKHWYGDKQKPGASRGIPPGYTVALREVHAQLAATAGADPSFTPEALQATYKDFTFYQGAIERAWKALSPALAPKRKLTPDEAIRVYGYLKASWGDLDAELSLKGNALNNDNRVSLAVATYLRAVSR